jgi:DNA-binding transcriptional regulator YdaS (Cro superfamily)
MELKNYLLEKRGQASQMSRLLGFSPTTISEWANGRKQVPAERCPDIERATNGQVTCEELRPDLAEQWAYLRSTSNPPERPSDDCGRRVSEDRRDDDNRRKVA